MRQRMVIVLGMHRSGTSLCANMLAQLGVDMADEPGASPANRRGHWERPRINDLHDSLLAALGRSWDDESHHLALPPDWLSDRRVAPTQAQLAEWLQPRLAASSCFGFKDPRTTRLLAMWPEILDRLDAEPVYIACVRHPAQVVRSVAVRDSFARDQAEYRWLVYNCDMVRGVGPAPVCIVPYESWFTDREATAERLARFVRADLREGDARPAELAADTVAPDLRHDADASIPVRPAADALHRLLLADVERSRFSDATQEYARVLSLLELSCLPMLRDAVSLRASGREQNRVIADLNALIERLRRDNQALRAQSAPVAVA